MINEQKEAMRKKANKNSKNKENSRGEVRVTKMD